MRANGAIKVFDLEKRVYLSLCENIGTPRALACWLLAKNDEWDQLIDLSIRPTDYENHWSFSDDYLVTQAMKKNPRLPINRDKAGLAREKFRHYEAMCSESNRRLSEYADGRLSPSLDVHRVIHYARENIRRILGPLTRSDLMFCEENMRFGPGATTSLSGVVLYQKKYSRSEVDATPRCLDFRLFGFPAAWKQVVRGVTPRKSSKFLTVPKDAKIDRGICKEPDLNVFVQLGTGALLRKKLADYGLDLNTQEHNQWAASVAQKEGLCTMDLSGASDCISQSLVWLLLPERWVELLHFSRTDYVQFEGSEVKLNKWSSMGNGYTFELETLIFYGVLLGTLEAYGMEGLVLAYGDDLIFPSELEDVVTRTLEFLGFSVNTEKTFGKGRFFESCGTDWFDGHNVRPIFFRTEHHDFPTVCYIYGNALSRWATRRNDGSSRDRRILAAWLRCFTAVSRSERLRIPEGFGDVGFIGAFDEVAPSTVRRKSERGWCGFAFKYRWIPTRRSRTSELGAYLSALNSQSSPFSYGFEAVRGRHLPAVTKVGYCLQWPYLGPWT